MSEASLRECQRVQGLRSKLSPKQYLNCNLYTGIPWVLPPPPHPVTVYITGPIKGYIYIYIHIVIIIQLLLRGGGAVPKASLKLSIL